MTWSRETLSEERVDPETRRNKNRNQRQTRLILGLAGLVLLSGSLYSLAVFVLSSLAGVDMVVAMAWEQKLTGPAWAFQREYPVFSDQQGLLIPIVNEGEKVSRGLEIARINRLGERDANDATNVKLYSPVAGLYPI